MGGLLTSHRDDVKILLNTTSSRCNVTGSVNLDFYVYNNFSSNRTVNNVMI